MRWWIPASIAVLAAANLFRVRFSQELDSNFKGMQTALTLAVFISLVVLWFLFFTRLRWRIRLAGLALIALAAFGLGRIVRMDSAANGSGTPTFAWKWTPKKTGEVGALNIVASSVPITPAVLQLDDAGYLGTNRCGVVEKVRLERDWASHPPRQVWRHPIGLGWSSFAVNQSLALTQEQRGDDELVVCYELKSGNVLWAHTNRVRFSETMGGDGPRATPTLFGDRVYAMGATGMLDCLDAMTGKSLWSHDVLKESNSPNLPFGKSSSPLICDSLVVVSGGFGTGPTLLTYHLNDGSPAWRAGTDKASFSSPTLATLADKKQIVSINAGSVTGHDPVDGRVLWEYPWSGQWPKCAQPVILDGERIFLSASFNAGCMVLQIKAGPDGKLSVAENWKNRIMKSEFSNIVARNGFAYGLDDGILACIDLMTGERKWKDGHYGHGQVILIGDLLLVQTEKGPVTLVEASPSGFRELATLNALTVKTWNVPAFAGNRLLVRNDQEAVCYDLALVQP